MAAVCEQGKQGMTRRETATDNGSNMKNQKCNVFFCGSLVIFSFIFLKKNNKTFISCGSFGEPITVIDIISREINIKM